MTLLVLDVAVVRDTSLQAYRDIIDSGRIGEVQKMVYEGLYKFGPCTSSELYEHMSTGQNVQHSNIRARLGELRDMGAVKEGNKRKCAVTSKTVLTWDVTMQIPSKQCKKLSKKEKIDKVLDKLRSLYGETDDPFHKIKIIKIADMVKEI